MWQNIFIITAETSLVNPSKILQSTMYKTYFLAFLLPLDFIDRTMK